MMYKEYVAKQTEAVNKLPIFYAFSDEQFKHALEERGIKLDEAKDKVYKFAYGGFYLKSDADKIREYFSIDHDAELRKIMEEDLDFTREAFEYEMYNHEYPINWQGDWDVVSCFGRVEFSEAKDGGDYLRELGFGDTILMIWRQVRAKVLENFDY